MSLLASFQSSVTILGYPAEMYTKGTQFWVVILSAIFASITAAELFLPVYFKLSFTSVNRVKYPFTVNPNSKIRLLGWHELNVKNLVSFVIHWSCLDNFYLLFDHQFWLIHLLERISLNHTTIHLWNQFFPQSIVYINDLNTFILSNLIH